VKGKRFQSTIFAGHIDAAMIVTNPATQARFHAMQIRTLHGMMDVVADPAIVVREPVMDGVVRETFWLSGRVLDTLDAVRNGGRL